MLPHLPQVTRLRSCPAKVEWTGQVQSAFEQPGVEEWRKLRAAEPTMSRDVRRAGEAKTNQR